MKARESALKLKRFEADEKARKVADLEHMIQEFEVMAHDLERQIQAEEDRTGIKDPAHFSYSTFAKSAGQRLANLHASIDELKVRLEAAAQERDDAAEQLDRASASETRIDGQSRQRRPEAQRGALFR